MLIAFTGLHAAGKSYLIEKISEEYAIKIFNKKQILKEMFIIEEQRSDIHYRDWFREEFYNDPVKIISRILSRLPMEETIILDSVHSFTEWKIINDLCPNSILVSVSTPKDIRSIRQDAGDDEANLKRMEYWHSDYEGKEGCLLSEVSWTFNGAASTNANLLMFEELLSYIKNREKNKANSKIIKLNMSNNQGSDKNEL